MTRSWLQRRAEREALAGARAERESEKARIRAEEERLAAAERERIAEEERQEERAREVARAAERPESKLIVRAKCFSKRSSTCKRVMPESAADSWRLRAPRSSAMSTKRISSDEAQLRAQSRATLAAQRRVEADSALEALRIEQAAVRDRTAKLRARSGWQKRRPRPKPLLRL